MSKNDSEVRIEDEYDLRKASGVIATAEAEFLERIGVGEPDPGPVRIKDSPGPVRVLLLRRRSRGLASARKSRRWRSSPGST